MTIFAPPPLPELDDVPAAAVPQHPLPLQARAARALVLAAVFACAACGLVYELALIGLGSFLIGNTVTQASVVLSVMVCSMGLGALAAKRLARRPAASFAVVEGALALVGGLSAVLLYAAFAWLDLYQPALVVVAVTVGALIGAEIPVLMALLQRIRAQDASDAVADLFAADYVGALVGGLSFPFVLLPVLGLVRGTLVVGMVNVAAAALVTLWLFGRDLGRRRLVAAGGLLAVGLVLAAVAVWSDRFEATARQALYEDPVVHAERSAYQEIVLTESISLGGRPDLRLFLNGDLQFSSVDEYRYHEALVHPAMAGRHASVLVLGGGDGLAAREVLRHEGVERLVQVDIDPAVTDLARTDDRLVDLNEGALGDPRVEVVHADAFAWVRGADERFDVVIADFPDAEDPALAKLYSTELYALTRRVLAPGGRLVVQAGSPYFARQAFWCVEATLADAGWASVPYQAEVPSFGNWGFHLAAIGGPPELVMPDPAPEGLRYLSPEVLAAADAFALDASRVDVDPSTLLRPAILEYQRGAWAGY